MNLENKTAIVTGGTRGIGHAIALALSQAGANVAISATNQEKCQEAAEKLSSQTGNQVVGIKANVTHEEEVSSLVSQVKEKWGSIDILVNNAGITKDNLLMRMSLDDWKNVIETNLTSVFLVTKAVIRPMLKQKKGTIINISSGVGVMGNPGQANYAASKGGIISFSKSIAKEYASKGIRCNVVAPGFISTEMTDTLPAEYLEGIAQKTPLRRLGKPEEVAHAVSFLASDLALFITGQVLCVDGGMVM
ncbi:MAG: 3-oxoacyl-ACP reductase FabG [Candidatus Margulisbacteria bacterium]|nr:3-oxoacyl-ACP reductase FabG [Candidatus Margulisiibacteriota bacterium]